MNLKRIKNAVSVAVVFSAVVIGGCQNRQQQNGENGMQENGMQENGMDTTQENGEGVFQKRGEQADSALRGLGEDVEKSGREMQEKGGDESE